MEASTSQQRQIAFAVALTAAFGCLTRIASLPVVEHAFVVQGAIDGPHV